MITYKTPAEIALMKTGGSILAAVLNLVAAAVAPGAAADELERLTLMELKKRGVKPAFLNYDTGYMGKYPAALCVSVNEEVVHGLPTKDKIFHSGDLIGLDLGIWYQDLCLDAALTVCCGEVSSDARKLANVASEALRIGITKCRIDNTVADISVAIQKYVEAQGFKIIKTLVGHGVGHKVHEDPQIPNFWPFDERHPEKRGALLKEGMTLALEPMISVSSEKTRRGRDRYAAVTADGSLAAHFEHTVAVTKRGPIILTI